MNNLMNRVKGLRKNSRKGFTLVEIIVVIVIIAILLAALTPAVIGWINEARDRALMAEGRNGLIAAQAVITEILGSNDTTNIANVQGLQFTGTNLDTYTTPNGKFSSLIGNTLSAAHFTFTTNPRGELETVVYNTGAGRIATWNDVARGTYPQGWLCE